MQSPTGTVCVCVSTDVARLLCVSTSTICHQETYTNAEFYEFVHPWSDSLPYTYDKFDFDYCASYGVSVV